MKVLHVCSESPWRGGEQQIIYLAEESLKLGVESIIACKKNSAVELYCQQHNLKYRAVPFRSAYDIRTAIELKKICSNESIQLIHSHTSKSHTMAVLVGLLGVRLPQVLTRRVNVPVKDNWFSRFKYNYSHIQKIICISTAVEKCTTINNPERKVVIHSGIDLSKFNSFKDSNWLRIKYGLSKHLILIGYTAAITTEKDFETFVRVAKSVNMQYPETRFFIIGDGAERDKILQLVSDLQLTEHVIFTGHLDNIPEVLPSLDLFLFTSTSEGLGTSVLDAMAAGVPIVTTAAGGISEMITHEMNGLMYPVKDEAGLTEGVIRMLKEPEMAKQFAARAKETVMEFSKEKTAARTVEVYKEILGRK